MVEPFEEIMVEMSKSDENNDSVDAIISTYSKCKKEHEENCTVSHHIA